MKKRETMRAHWHNKVKADKQKYTAEACLKVFILVIVAYVKVSPEYRQNEKYSYNLREKLVSNGNNRVEIE